MPGEMVTLLLGVQGGDEESFACLYAVTNPVIVRYLRVVSDSDPAPLALTTWSTLLHRMPACVADDDDDWLELAVGTARETVLAASAIRASSTPAPDGSALPAGNGAGQELSDPVDEGVAALRACGPVLADVLAMGVVAGLGRDSIARISGLEPTEVLALVNEGQGRLALPLETLIATMQVPGSPAEVGDLPAVLPLFAEQSRSPLPAAAAILAPAAAPAETSSAAPEVAAAALATGAVATGALAAASAGEPSVVDLLTWGSPAPASRAAMRRAAEAAEGGDSARWIPVAAGAAAWAIAVGGIGTAAAMSGVIPAALHNLFGDQGHGTVIVAHGPVRPGQVPPGTGAGPGTTTRPPGTQPGPQGPVKPATTPVGTSPTGGDVIVSAAGSGTSTQVVVVPAVLTDSSPKPAPTTPSPSGTPPTSSPPPTEPGVRIITIAGHAWGKGHPKHSTGLAKGRAKAAQAAAKAEAAAARARAKAAAARARAAAKAAAAAAKAAAAQAKAAAKAEAKAAAKISA